MLNKTTGLHFGKRTDLSSEFLFCVVHFQSGILRFRVETKLSKRQFIEVDGLVLNRTGSSSKLLAIIHSMFPSLSVEALAAGLSPNESLFPAESNATFLASDPGTLLLHLFSNNI